MKISVLDWDTMSCCGDLTEEKLRSLGDVSIFGLTAPEDTVKNIGDADAVLCNKVLITREIMEKCPYLKYIGLFATGFNNVDIEAAAEKNITVCNAGQYASNAVAQHTFAYILDHYSRIRDCAASVAKGGWEASRTFSYFPVPTYELAGKTISIIGYGSIGKAVAKIADAFGMKVVISTRTIPDDCPYEITDVTSAAEKADILTLHCPLTEKTARLVNEKLLSVMKETAILINTSRGGTVDEKALAAALNNGKIAAAYLDVLDKEPMTADTPMKNIPGCIITPHSAWAAYETRERLLDIVCDNFISWTEGNIKNKVN